MVKMIKVLLKLTDLYYKRGLDPLFSKVQTTRKILEFKAATGGKAAKVWFLAGFWEIENGGGSDGARAGEVAAAMASLPTKNLLWRPWKFRFHSRFEFQREH